MTYKEIKEKSQKAAQNKEITQFSSINTSSESETDRLLREEIIIHTREELLFESLKTYYTKDKLDILVPIILGETPYSLRNIEWFVVNYSKSLNINYIVKENGKDVYFNVFARYNIELDSWQKDFFDPFCRLSNKKNKKTPKKRAIEYTNKQYIINNTPQLNFFKWAIEYKILDYVRDHLDEITKDQNIRGKSKKKINIESSESEKKPEKNRRQISKSSIKVANQHFMPIEVSF